MIERLKQLLLQRTSAALQSLKQLLLQRTSAALQSFSPQRASRLLQRLQGFAGQLQGIGYGSLSIADEVRAIAPLLPAHDAVVFDVGANCGDWTRSLLAIAPSQISRIVAFEPSMHHAKALSALPSPPCEVVAMAVASSEGMSRLYSNAPGSGLASLHERRLEHFDIQHRFQEMVTTTTLDSFCQSRQIEIIHFLKMDVEGHEYEALKGAAGLLSRRSIRGLAFEFGGCNIDSRTFFQDFWYLLRGHGFDIFRVAPGGRLWPVLQYSEALEAFVTTNYVAVLRDAVL